MQHKTILFSTQYHQRKLTSVRHPCEWKQRLINEAHFVYLAATLGTKGLPLMDSFATLAN